MSESSSAVAAPVVIKILVESVRPSAHQIRRDFDEESNQSLALSIEKEGLIQPITVRRVSPIPANADTPIQYELVAGERRWRAVKSLGWKEIDAIVIEVVNEAAASAKGLVENLQRKGLNPLEEAEGFAQLNKLDPVYWTQEMVGTISGKSRIYVNKSISLLALPDSIQGGVRNRTLSREQGLELARLSAPKHQKQQETLAKKAEKGLSSKKLRTTIDAILGGQTGSGSGEPQKPLKESSPFRFSKKGYEIVFSGKVPLIIEDSVLVAQFHDALLEWRKGGEKNSKSVAESVPPSAVPEPQTSSSS